MASATTTTPSDRTRASATSPRPSASAARRSRSDRSPRLRLRPRRWRNPPTPSGRSCARSLLAAHDRLATSPGPGGSALDRRHRPGRSRRSADPRLLGREADPAARPGPERLLHRNQAEKGATRHDRCHVGSRYAVSRISPEQTSVSRGAARIRTRFVFCDRGFPIPPLGARRRQDLGGDSVGTPRFLGPFEPRPRGPRRFLPLAYLGWRPAIGSMSCRVHRRSPAGFSRR